MSLSFPILNDLGDSLIHLLRAGDYQYSIPACLEQAEKSALFRKLLEFEDRVLQAAYRVADDRHSLRDLLSIVGGEFSPLIPSETLQTILFGGGALQLADDVNLSATAAISLNLLRRSAPFPPPGFPLHADLPLSDVIAQLRLEELGDALKPIRVAATRKEREAGPGESGAAAAGSAGA